VGFQEYFGLNEYPYEGDYDGSWGIWDHRFYPFFKTKLDHFKQPFLAAFFSLSSHHPYAIPKEYKKRFQQKKAIDRALAYSDFSLSLFFKEAKKSTWFKNTIFVLSADHSAELPGTYDSTNRVFFEIPIAIFSPGDSLLRQKPHRKVMQQSDVFPTLMDYLNFPDSFIAFGNSIFDIQASDFALYYLNGIYHGQSADYDFDFDGNTFTFTNKTFQRADSLKQQALKQKVKAEIQNYNRRLLYNQLTQENR
jgi:phosphoglycerol transferase MdoB-like AlkP superfamily enzyme